MAKEIPEEEKLAILKEYLNSPEGKKQISFIIHNAIRNSPPTPKKGVMESVLEGMGSDKRC